MRVRVGGNPELEREVAPDSLLSRFDLPRVGAITVHIDSNPSGGEIVCWTCLIDQCLSDQHSEWYKYRGQVTIAN